MTNKPDEKPDYAQVAPVAPGEPVQMTSVIHDADVTDKPATVEASTDVAPVTDKPVEAEVTPVTEADTVLSDHVKAMAAIASADDAAVEADKPVNVATVKVAGLPTDKSGKPLKGTTESNKAFKKRLAAFNAIIKPVEPAVAKPTGNGKPAAKPATPAPVITPAPAPAITAVKPAKPVKAGKPVIEPGDNSYGGYDFTDWPTWLSVKPSREAVFAAIAVDSARPTKGTLSIACGLEMGNPAHDDLLFNVYDLGHGMHTVDPVRGTKPDQKQVHVNVVVRRGLLRRVQVQAPDRHPLATPGNRPRACDRVYLTAAGLKMVEAAFAGAGLAVPQWLSDPAAARQAMADEALAQAVEAENAKAAALAAREAKKQAKKANA